MQLKLTRLLPWFAFAAVLTAWVAAAQQPAPVVTSGALLNAALDDTRDQTPVRQMLVDFAAENGIPV